MDKKDTKGAIMKISKDAHHNLEKDTPTACWINVRECGASGSEFEAQGRMLKGSNRMEVEDAGDFQAGQWVIVAPAHFHSSGIIYKPDQSPLKTENQIPLSGEIELRGLDMTKSWQTFILLFEKTNLLTFSWLAVDPEFQPVMANWTWQGHNLAMNDRDWYSLCDGVEMRFRKLDWAPGQVVAIHARTDLITQVKKIANKVIVLNDCAGQDAPQAVLRHFDQYALQNAINRAIAEKKSILIPAGRYRLRNSLQVKGACFRIEGEHRANTILDISAGNGPVFNLIGGREVAIRNLGMVGHTGFNELPFKSFKVSGGCPFWPTANQQAECKGCSAVIIDGTERALFEDLHVTRMASEAFYSHGSGRFEKQGSGDSYTKSIIYHRCCVIDCASNAFNNNDFAENTSILHCYVENVSNFFEQSSRFTRVIGNTVRNATHFGSTGNIHDAGQKSFQVLGTGQTIITGNVFEFETTPKDTGGGISIGSGPAQVIVSDNVFVNCGQRNVITASGRAFYPSMPARSITITGNIIDLTQVGDQPEFERIGIYVSASNVVVSNNQIYARGACAVKAAGIVISEQAVNVNVHDNLIENCGRGLQTGLIPYASWVYNILGLTNTHGIESEVVEAIGPGVFSEKKLFSVWDNSPGYRNWILCWLTGANTGQSSRIKGLRQTMVVERSGYNNKAAVKVIELADAVTITPGDRFIIYPSQANWNIHHNTITGCQIPVELRSTESGTSRFKDNIIASGTSELAPVAVISSGKFLCSDNIIAGFDKEYIRQ